jgi:hypothetical protein
MKRFLPVRTMWLRPPGSFTQQAILPIVFPVGQMNSRVGHFMHVRDQEGVRVQIGINRNLGPSIRVNPEVTEFRATRSNHPKVKLVLLPELTTVYARLPGKIVGEEIRQRSKIKKAL